MRHFNVNILTNFIRPTK